LAIAVTGASGRLGHAVLRALQARGATDVVGVARKPERVLVPAVTLRAGDYHAPGSLATALAGVDTAVLISAPVVPGSDRVALHRNVIAAARAAGVGRVIYTSVVGHGDAEHTLFAPTQQANRRSEAELRGSGLGWTILRNGLYLELDVAHVLAAGPAGVYANPGGDGRAPYITIDELAFATAQVALGDGHAGRTYNLAGECLSQRELVERVNEVFGLAVRYEAIDDEAWIEKFRRLRPERGEGVARMLTGCFQCIREGIFDVPSDYETAAGRPPKTVRAMLEELRGRSPAQSAG
jgi:NAD(P)H dehydrogenase (quinone)